MTLVKIRNLSKNYGEGENEVKALNLNYSRQYKLT